MSLLKQNTFYSRNFFFVLLLSFLSLGLVQEVSAAVPTDPASCTAVSGDCKLKYNTVGLTWGMSCTDQTSGAKPVEFGMCYSNAQASKEYSGNSKDVVKICCVVAIPVACATPNSCTTPQAGDCPGGRLVATGSCTGADAGKLCCAPSASGGPVSCPGGVCTGTACPSNYPTASGACDGGGTCCMSATVPGGASTTIPFKNPLAFGTVEGVLGSILGTLRGIIVVLALVFIVIGAVLYITSAGNDERMKTAKGAITASMIGLALGIAAPSFLKQIGDILGWGAVTNSLPAGTRTLTEIALSVLRFLLSIVGILGIIMLVIGGLAYLTSAGNEERADSGKKIVTYAIIGIAVALAALVIVTQIATLFAP